MDSQLVRINKTHPPHSGQPRCASILKRRSYLIWQKRTSRKGQAEKDKQKRTSRKGQAEKGTEGIIFDQHQDKD